VCARGKGSKRVRVCSVQVVVKHRSELMKTNFAQIALTVDRREERSGRDYGVYTPAPSRSLALSLSLDLCVLVTPTPVTSSSSSESTDIM